MRWGVDSQEDISRHTVKPAVSGAVNTSVDSTVGKSAHTVIVLCVNVNNKFLGNTMLLVFFFVFLYPEVHTLHVLEIYIDRSSCVISLKSDSFMVLPRSSVT